MAIRSSASSGSYLSRTASIPDIEANYTAFAWFKIEVDTNNYAHVMHLGGAYSYDGNSDFIGTNSDGTTFRSGSVVAFSGNFPVFDALTVGQWYWTALVRDGASSLKVYRGTNGSDGALIGTITTAVSFRPSPLLMSMLDYNGAGMNGSVAHWRCWTAALSLSELNAEAASATLVRATSVWSYTTLDGADVAAAILDQSGNARHWTANGSLTLAAGPTIGGGVTSTAAGRAGARAEASTSKGSPQAAAARAGVQAAAATAKSTATATEARAGARAAASDAKAALAAVAARTGARAAASTAKAVGTALAGRAGLRASAAAAKSASSSTAARAGARAATAADAVVQPWVPQYPWAPHPVELAVWDASVYGSAWSVSVVALMPLAFSTSVAGRAGARGATATGKAASGATAARSGARAAVATSATLVPLTSTSARAGARASAAMAKAALAAADARAGLRATVTTVQITGITASSSGRAGARGASASTKGGATTVVAALGLRGDSLVSKASSTATAARLGLLAAAGGGRNVLSTVSARLGVRGAVQSARLLPLNAASIWELPPASNYYVLPLRSR